MAPKTLPEQGYNLDHIFFVDQAYRLVPPDEIPDDAEDEVTSYTWDWFPHDAETFFVRLGAQTSPSADRPVEVSAMLVASFTFRDEQSVDFRTFVCREAPMMLFPYLREALTSLTNRGLYEPYFHPPVDIAQIVAESFRFEDATGSQFVAERADLQQVYGAVLTVPKSRSLSSKTVKKTTRKK